MRSKERIDNSPWSGTLDRNTDALAPDAMLLLNEAWEVLGDLKLRAEYDRQYALARSNIAEAARQRRRQKAEYVSTKPSSTAEPPWYRATEDQGDGVPTSNGENSSQKGCGSKGCLWTVGIIVAVVLLIAMFGSCNESECERAFRDAGVYERFIPEYCD